jgi:hypothetical protein
MYRPVVRHARAIQSTLTPQSTQHRLSLLTCPWPIHVFGLTQFDLLPFESGLACFGVEGIISLVTVSFGIVLLLKEVDLTSFAPVFLFPLLKRIRKEKRNALSPLVEKKKLTFACPPPCPSLAPPLHSHTADSLVLPATTI